MIQEQVAGVLESAKPDPNRPTTAADVAALIKAWQRLASAVKDHRTALSDLNRSMAVYTEGSDYSGFQLAVEETAKRLTSELLACRIIIDGLPNGVTGPGGKATRQTVVLEFYGPVNRNLKLRLSASDAKAINKAAFGA